MGFRGRQSWSASPSFFFASQRCCLEASTPRDSFKNNVALLGDSARRPSHNALSVNSSSTYPQTPEKIQSEKRGLKEVAISTFGFNGRWHCSPRTDKFTSQSDWCYEVNASEVGRWVCIP